MSNDVQIWQRRWDSISSTIQQTKTDLTSKTIDRKDAFISLVQALERFGKAQFDFFFKGFSLDDPTRQTLEKSLQFPPEFVLKRILDQLANDIWVIESAIKQREDANKVAALKQADLLAFRAIEPAKGDGRLLSADTTVITYFQKVPEVRILPYANVVLIGVPYAANLTGQPDKDSSLRDLLAIPHEAGHFVFWRGMINGERLHITLRQRLSQAGLLQYDHWLEEIFADVYGCLIAGSAFALSAQDLQLDNMPIRLTEDDGRHPAAVVRPYIPINVLDSEAGNATADPIRTHWQGRIKSKGDPQYFHLKTSDQPVSVATAASNDIKIIVEFILATLKAIPNMTNVFHLDWSDRQPSDPADLTSLYKSFTDKLSLVSSGLQVGSFAVLDTFGIPDKNTSWVHKLRDDLPVTPGNKLPAELWLVVLYAAGWGSGGQEETYPNRP